MFGVVVALMIGGGVYYYYFIRSKRPTQPEITIEPELVITERGLLDNENVKSAEFKEFDLPFDCSQFNINEHRNELERLCLKVAELHRKS